MSKEVLASIDIGFSYLLVGGAVATVDKLAVLMPYIITPAVGIASILVSVRRKPFRSREKE